MRRTPLLAAAGIALAVVLAPTARADTQPSVKGHVAVSYDFTGRVPPYDHEARCNFDTLGSGGGCYGQVGLSVALQGLPQLSNYDGYFTADIMESFGCPPHQEYPRRHAVILSVGAEARPRSIFGESTGTLTRPNGTGTLTRGFRLNSPIDGLGPTSTLDCTWINRSALVLRNMVAHLVVTDDSGGTRTYDIPLGTHVVPYWGLLH